MSGAIVTAGAFVSASTSATCIMPFGLVIAQITGAVAICAISRITVTMQFALRSVIGATLKTTQLTASTISAIERNASVSAIPVAIKKRGVVVSAGAIRSLDEQAMIETVKKGVMA